MARQSGQSIKLFRLAEILREESNELSPLSIYDLIARLKRYGINAGRVTLRADIDTLIALGLDIVERQEGKRKVFFLGDREFSLSEIKMLMDSVRASKYISPNNTAKIINKLLKIAGKEKSRLYNSIQYSQNHKKCKDNALIYIIDEINRALTERRMVSFRYFNYRLEGGKDYRYDGQEVSVTPVSLVCNEDNYYMDAYSAQDDKIKTYRVDRLEGLTVTDCPAKSNDLILNHDSERNRVQTFSMYGGVKQAVTLRVDKGLGMYVVEEFGDTLRLIDNNDNHYTVSVDVQISPTFFAWCFSFAGGLKILKPAQVAEEFCRHIDKVIASCAPDG